MKKIFIDMDGTLTKWKNSSYSELLKKGYYKSLEPTKLVDAVNELLDVKEYRNNIYILSKYLEESSTAYDDKKMWIETFLPKLKSENILLIPNEMSKSDFVSNRFIMGCSLNKEFVLLDDYHKNLDEWLSHGGCTAKYINGINSQAEGLMLFDDDNLENLYDSLIDCIFSDNDNMLEKVSVVKMTNNNENNIVDRILGYKGLAIAECSTDTKDTRYRFVDSANDLFVDQNRYLSKEIVRVAKLQCIDYLEDEAVSLQNSECIHDLMNCVSNMKSFCKIIINDNYISDRRCLQFVDKEKYLESKIDEEINCEEDEEEME